MQQQLADAASKLRATVHDADALDDLDDAVEEMAGVLRFYEAALETHSIRRPYFRPQVD